jgi:hypothetical protein
MSANKTSLLLEKVSKKEKIVRENDLSSNDTLLLLANNEKQQEVNILKQIGLDSHIREVETKHNDLTRIEVIQRKYNRNVYTGKQLKQVCNENNLRLLRADNFKGKVPVELIGQETLKFIEENTREVVEQKRKKKGYFQDEDELDNEGKIVYKEITKKVVDVTVTERSFFILSTTKSFKGKQIESATLFYREDSDRYDINYASEEDIFVEICSWGKTFNNNFTFMSYITHCHEGGGIGIWTGVCIIAALFGVTVAFFTDTNINYLLSIILFVNAFGILAESDTDYFNQWNQYEN